MQIYPAVSGQISSSYPQQARADDGAIAQSKSNAEAIRVSQEHSKLDKAELEKVTDQFNQVLQTFNIQAKFSVHEKTNEIMVSIINIQTDEVIREIPPRKILDMVARMMEMVGVIIDEKA